MPAARPDLERPAPPVARDHRCRALHRHQAGRQSHLPPDPQADRQAHPLREGGRGRRRGRKERHQKGYEYEKGDYVLLEDEELDAVKLETKKTLELVQFVDEGEIPPLYFDTALLRGAVRRAGGGRLPRHPRRPARDQEGRPRPARAARQRVPRRAQAVRQGPAARDAALRGRDQEGRQRSSPTSPAKSADDELLDVATVLIEKKTHKLDAGELQEPLPGGAARADPAQDEAQGPEAHRRGRGRAEERDGDNVIDLMAALKKSLEGKSATGSSSTPRQAQAGARKSPC